MTLILAIPAQGGVIFASDSQITSGQVRSTGTKIFKLNDQALWGGSGEVALIQRVAERLANFPDSHQPLDGVRDSLAGFVKEAIHSLLNVDFRTQFVAQNPEALLMLHRGDFLFVEHRDEPRILHIVANGTPEWISERFAATGSGDLFAHALLQKYARHPLTCAHAKLLAYKVMEEAIEVGAYGLGPPIDIWEVGPKGITQASEPEITGLKDAARLLREREVEMLTSSNNNSPPKK